MKKLFFLFFVGALNTSSLLAEAIPGQTLLGYFSANCRTQGEWTKSALADSTSLIETLRSLSQDQDCKSVTGAISQLGLLNQQLYQLEKVNETQSKMAQLNAQEQELLIQVSQNSDPTVLAELNEKLRDLQFMRAGLIGKEKAQNELMDPDKVQVLTGVVQMANSAFAQVTANQKCLAKNPTLLKTATSVISAVSATATAINPALGISLNAGSAFLGETIEGIRKTYNARTIKKISENSIASEAYKCALETISERWCQMRDAESFLIFKAEQRKHPGFTPELGNAIRLNDRELPVLIEWLNKIRSGVTPTTTSDAQRQNQVFTRETFIRTIEGNGLGLIEENRRIYNSYSNMTERWNFLRSLILSLLPSPNVGFKNPFYEVYPMGYAPFFLIGLPDDRDIRNPQGDYYPIDAWTKPEGFNPTLDLVKEKYIEWVAKARARVNQELNQVLQPDPLQTLSSAFDRTGNRWKISPMDSLKRMIEFLETNPPGSNDLAFKKIYDNTIARLKEIYSITTEAVLRLDIIATDNDNTTTVQKIYEIAQLRYGPVVMESRLDMIIRLSLLELIENSPPEDQVVVAQLLAAERFTETISRMSGTDNLALIRADINRAQPITLSNLSTFIQVFGKNINKILEKLIDEERGASPTVARSKRYSRTEMCFLLLSVPEVNSYINVKYCEGLQMKPIISGGPASFVISPATFKADVNERACEYREFFRKSKIYETWGIK